MENGMILKSIVDKSFTAKHDVVDYREEEGYSYIIVSWKDGWTRKEIDNILKEYKDSWEVEYIREEQSWQINIF